jgi:hypothetical protein
VARSRRRRMISAVKPDEPASNFQQRDNTVGCVLPAALAAFALGLGLRLHAKLRGSWFAGNRRLFHLKTPFQAIPKELAKDVQIRFS